MNSIDERLRKSDRYFREIDYIKNELLNGNTSGNIELDNIQDNKKQLTSHFSDDVLCYYEFNDKNNLGFDSSTYKRESKNIGGMQIKDNIRDVGINFLQNFNDDDRDNLLTPRENARYLKLENIDDIKNSNALTVCGWIKPEIISSASAISSIFSMTNPTSVYESTFQRDTQWGLLIERTEGIRFLPWAFNGTELNIFKGTVNTGIAFDTWVHFAFCINENSNAFYVNGVLQNTYETGDANIGINLSDYDNFIIGGMIINKNYLNSRMSNLGNRDMFRWRYSGSMSDFIVFNRFLSPEEVNRIYSNDYGYDCIILSGQSNMMGRDFAIAGIDDDYSLFNDLVYQYSTINNIDENNYSVLGYNILKLEMPANIQDLPLDYAWYYNNPKDGRASMIRTFLNDYIQYYKKNYTTGRYRRIMLLPAANGSTSVKLFQPGQKHYEIMKTAANEILSKPWNRIDSYFWIQGESDSRTGEFNLDYEADYNNMISSFKNDIGVSDLKIINATLSMQADFNFIHQGYQMKFFINDIFYKLAENDINIETVETNFLTLYDSRHYDVRGLRTLGHLFFDAYCKLNNVENPRPSKILTIDKANDTIYIDGKAIKTTHTSLIFDEMEINYDTNVITIGGDTITTNP